MFAREAEARGIGARRLAALVPQTRPATTYLRHFARDGAQRTAGLKFYHLVAQSASEAVRPPRMGLKVTVYATPVEVDTLAAGRWHMLEAMSGRAGATAAL